MGVCNFTSGAAALCALVILVSSGCNPIPRRPLTTEEKTADLFWLYSQFTENYAPLDYKMERFRFNFETLKGQYLRASAATSSNDEFYALMHNFVSHFKDAHTSASLTVSDLPGRAKVGYLGFSGKRVGDYLVVTEILPTIDVRETHYPISVGMKIVKLDGVPLKEIVSSEMVRYRDLGQDESNFTYHMNRVFNRISFVNGLPIRKDAALTVLKPEKSSSLGGKEVDQNSNDKEEVKEVIAEITLPWVIKDIVDFEREQYAARPRANAMTVASEDRAGSSVKLGFIGFDGQIVFPGETEAVADRQSEKFDVWSTFTFVDNVASWTANFKMDSEGKILKESATPQEALKRVRNVPERAVFIPEATVYPTYLTREEVKTTDGKSTGKYKFVATMVLNTFSPAASGTTVISQIKSVLDMMQYLGAEDLVIDLVNNGGGSLLLGMRIAQMLSNVKLVMPEIQFRLNEGWVDDIERSSRHASSDTLREIYGRVFQEFQEEMKGGKRLSQRYNVEILSPYELTPNTEIKKKLNIYLLVNEMCASMCDIFTAILKDNEMATVVGSRTMGAGGNVVEYRQAPNSRLDIRQTESLVLRKDGSYIENNGVAPDVFVDVNTHALTKYAAVRQKALDLILITETPK